MYRDEYIVIQLSMIPQELVEKYNIAEKAHNGYIYARVTKVMYSLPQAGRIEHEFLLKILNPYGYHPSIENPGLWKHNS